MCVNLQLGIRFGIGLALIRSGIIKHLLNNLFNTFRCYLCLPVQPRQIDETSSRTILFANIYESLTFLNLFVYILHSHTKSRTAYSKDENGDAVCKHIAYVKFFNENVLSTFVRSCAIIFPPKLFNRCLNKSI